MGREEGRGNDGVFEAFCEWRGVWFASRSRLGCCWVGEVTEGTRYDWEEVQARVERFVESLFELGVSTWHDRWGVA